MKFRVVKSFAQGITPTTEKSYRVESVELMSESDAFKLLEALGSPYEGRKYEEKTDD